MQTCDTMEMDGIRIDSPAYALSVSDALPADMVRDRVASIASLRGDIGGPSFICVRDDAMDGSLLADAALTAEDVGLGLILESMIPANLSAAADALDGRRPLLMSPAADPLELASAAAERGLPVALTCEEPEMFTGLALRASAMGCCDVILHPAARSMKQCLESTVRTRRLSPLPVMARAWSGEYALAVASVAVLRGASLVVLDDLDPAACSVLECVSSNLAGRGFRFHGSGEAPDRVRRAPFSLLI